MTRPGWLAAAAVVVALGLPAAATGARAAAGGQGRRHPPGDAAREQIGLEVALKQVETAQWHPMVTRREYQLAANRTGIGIDDPDANFYENYACGSPRNYSDYCDPQIMKLIDQQSEETDPQRRLAIVWDIQKKLEEDGGRPIMGWATDRFAHRPQVRNLVPHQTVYSFGRMQEVWLEAR